MNFWLTIGLMTLVICVIAFYPLLRKTTNRTAQKRDSLNKAFYFDRLQEVEREANEGVIDDPEQTKRELQQSLLDDIPENASEQPLAAQKSFGKVWFVALILLVGGMSAGVYWHVGSWFTGTMLEMSHKKLDYFYERLKNEEADPLSETEMNQFAMALRVELQDKPQDAESWFLLGQIGMATENWDMALDSYAKASNLQPANLLYKQKLAELLMMSQDPKDKAKGEELVKAIIKVDHTNLGALRLLAFHLFEKEDYKMAAMTWGMVLKLMPDNDPSRATIERSMQAAMSMLTPEEKQATPEPEPQK
ncbi:c-type cytochrome biogenesis protein CcmI [Pasteurellaceae bacterium Orientalotternb1]|nr:c-type cytochrome biogenesis protein CcmI [Pasteurellaceae bacterium Orientalotternb1]